LFYKREDSNLYCGVHVDDMIVVSSNEEFDKKHMKEINKKINMKNLGEAKTTVGIQVEHMGHIEIHWKDYIKKLLEMYEIKKYKPAVTPIDVKNGK